MTIGAHRGAILFRTRKPTWSSRSPPRRSPRPTSLMGRRPPRLQPQGQTGIMSTKPPKHSQNPIGRHEHGRKNAAKIDRHRRPTRDIQTTGKGRCARTPRAQAREVSRVLQDSTSARREASRVSCSIRMARPCRSTSLPTWVSRWSGGSARTWKPPSNADNDAVKHRKGDHPVYSLVSLTGTDGRTLIFSDTGDDGDGDGAGDCQANQLRPATARPMAWSSSPATSSISSPRA